MPTFGKFETVSEVFQSSRGAVFAARPSGSEKKATFAIKTFEPVAIPGLVANDRAGTQRFLEAAEVQKAVAAKRTKHWAPVIELGDYPGGAYYVSHYYARSLERLIDGRIRVSSDTLVHVIRSLVRALREIDARAGRGHGNLKATNIFLADIGSLHESRLVVSDPLAGSALAGLNIPAEDYKALGTILFRLVRRRDVKGEVGWPVTASPDWDALGAKSERWRELCNTLLDPQVASKGLTLDVLEKQIRALKFRGARRRVMFGSIAVPATLAFAGFLYLRFTPYERMPERLIDFAEAIGNVPPDVAVPPEEWSKLCLAYYDWLGALQDALRDSDRRAQWERDQFLRDNVLAKLADAADRKISLDPRVVAHVDGNLSNLAATPPDIVKKGSVRWHILRSWKIVEELRTSLGQWPQPANLQSTADRWTKAGWNNPAAELKDTVTRDQPKILTPDTIDDLLALNRRAAQVDAASTEANRHAATLQGTGDALLSGLFEYTHAPTLEATDIDGLTDALAKQNRELARWDTFVRDVWINGVDQNRFKQESPAAAEHGAITPERIARWQDQVHDYQYVSATDDPRQQVDWADLSNRVAKALEQYRNEERSAGPSRDAQAVSGAALQQRVDSLAGTVKTFTGAKLIRKDIATALTRSRELAAEHRTLVEQIGNAVILLHPDVGDWLKWVQGPVFADLPTVQSVWSERSRQLVGNATARELAADSARFQELRTRVRTLETFLRGLATAPQLPAPVVAAQTARADFRQHVECWLKTQRDSALTQLLNRVAWQDGLPQGDAASAWNSVAGIQASTTYTRAQAAAADMAQSYTDAAAALTEGRGIEEGIDALARKVAAYDGVGDLLHSGPFAPITAAIDELHQIAGQNDRNVLANRTADGTLSGSLAAWRRLGALRDWPNNLKELEREAALAATLRPKVVTAEPEPERKARLEAEFVSEERIRWRKALRGAVDAGGNEVSSIFERMAAFGWAEADLDAPVRYDLQLNRFKTETSAARTAEDADAARAKFLASIQSTTGIARQSEITAFANAVRAVSLVKGDPLADLRALGPGSAGWTLNAADDPTRITYRWTTANGQNHELAFVFVELLQSDPFYLCTTEMPIGLLLDLADAKPTLNYVAEAMPTWIGSVQSAAEDQRQGPQVWAVDIRRHKLRLNDKWTGVRMPSWPDQVYARGVEIRPPDRQSPAQYLDPQAARFCAERLLGCRLPAPVEWTELLQNLGGREKLLKLTWNLRDARWQEQQTYLVRSGGAFDLPWPDADIFVPTTLGVVPRGKDAVAAATSDDGQLWFADVNSGTVSLPFVHLLGNVAEYLWDPKTQKYGVAGGSALSPGQVDPTAVYAVDSNREREGYSDVGFRPAFNAPDSLVGKSRLSRLVREQGYLSL